MSGASAAASSSVSVTKKSPSDYLKSLVGRPVVVRLTSGVDYRGASSSRGALRLAVCTRGVNSVKRATLLPPACLHARPTSSLFSSPS